MTRKPRQLGAVLVPVARNSTYIEKLGELRLKDGNILKSKMRRRGRFENTLKKLVGTGKKLS